MICDVNAQVRLADFPSDAFFAADMGGVSATVTAVSLELSDTMSLELSDTLSLELSATQNSIRLTSRIRAGAPDRFPVGLLPLGGPGRRVRHRHGCDARWGLFCSGLLNLELSDTQR